MITVIDLTKLKYSLNEVIPKPEYNYDSFDFCLHTIEQMNSITHKKSLSNFKIPFCAVSL